MAEPIPTPTPVGPLPITQAQVTTNGAAEEPFGNDLEAMYAQAFHKDKPDLYPAPEAPKSNAPEPTKLPESRKPIEAPKPEEKPPAKAAQWKEVNEERARLKKENEDFKLQQEKWKTWETERTEDETVKKRNEEMSKIVQEIALERLPEFKKHFDDRRNTALAIGSQIIGEEHAATLKKIAQLPDGEFRNKLIKDIHDNLEDYQKSQLGNVLTKFSEINYERNAELQRATERLKTYQQQRDQQQEQQRTQDQRALDSKFKEVVDSWSSSENGIPFLQMKDGDDAHNSEVKEILRTADNMIKLNLNADQLVKGSLWGAMAPKILRSHLATLEELKAVKAENEQLKSGGPELKGGEAPAPAGDTPDDFGTAEGLLKRLQAAHAGQR